MAQSQTLAPGSLTARAKAAAAHILATVPAFRGLPESTLDLIARNAELVKLNSGDFLFKEGDDDDSLYIVASGTLEMAGTLRDGRAQRFARFGRGDSIGDTVVLFHQPRPASVYASSPAELFKLSLSLLSTLFDRHGALHQEMRRAAARRLLSFHLASSPVLAGIDIDSLRVLDGDANRVQLDGGETLFRQGDAPDYLYVVLCGRLEVTVKRGDGAEEVIAHVTRGGCVGEMGLLTGEQQSTTVRATRDTQLVRLSENQFEMLLDRHPACIKEIAKALPRIIHNNGATAPKDLVRTIAIVPAAGSRGLPPGFMERLVRELSNIAEPAFDLSSTRIDYELGHGSSAPWDQAAHTRLISWLAVYEEKFPYLLLECDPHVSAWTALCLRHADLILIVGDAKGDPLPGHIESALSIGALSTTAARTELVLVHSNAARLPSGTDEWLKPRRVDAHHHVRCEHTPDYQRLARFISGQAVGLVLSGGGARGIAHIGAIQALAQSGVPIDFTGGTSIGAAVAAHWAMTEDVEALARIGRDFSSNFHQHFFRDLTLPFVSLNSARRFSKCLEHLFGDTRIEDLWLPYFCTSSNLTKAQAEIHDRGVVWTWVRASSSIPGIWPPVIRDGQMLVDGGVINNLPIDVMRKRCRGPVVAVNVSPVAELNLHSGPQAQLSGWPMLKRLNPFRKKTEVPHIFGILYRSAQLGSICSADSIKGGSDLYLQPPTSQVDLFDWKTAHTLIDTSYRHCMNDIEQWKLRQ
jgi:predicted acylesterase/phospholipase RssA/CRP-like cAMP-binding protein